MLELFKHLAQIDTIKWVWEGKEQSNTEHSSNKITNILCLNKKFSIIYLLAYTTTKLISSPS